jgi:hypothetical protein
MIRQFFRRIPRFLKIPQGPENCVFDCFLGHGRFSISSESSLASSRACDSRLA